jgi:hypothetical protein
LQDPVFAETGSDDGCQLYRVIVATVQGAATISIA